MGVVISVIDGDLAPKETFQLNVSDSRNLI